ncbi:MAG: hypothetical protein A9Z00_08710 [Thermobacillus sp. ZCTH02-B1]|uniref:hypothetical protein n=1 Tax=Thermobacillus sp. ZCTH02-B1 TaxID=1858795 RepID=UPI000B58687C|nr:hypothetical protein [Thermobacillus sp. ZCTH02-B1]OUM95410.1 MAG: hypothetical protein A9Z00_08710 [Thermobacillus sp. ZCTH02-B1]
MGRNRRLEKLLEDGDRWFEGFFEWLDGQYDVASGGFYYAASSRRTNVYGPDIESTAQALNILERTGLIGRWSDRMRRKAVRFFQARQDPDTGLFYHADPNMRLDGVSVARALGYSLGALRMLGAEPLHPVPERSPATPAYMESPAAYGEWLRSVSLSNSWRGCDIIASSAVHLLALPPEKRAPYVREAFAHLNRIQDPESGLWGEGTRYVRISGTFKLHIFYERFGVPLPRKAEIYRSILETLREDEATDMCYIRNPISLLASMRLAIPAEELEEICEMTLRNMGRLKQGDGGFSRELGHSVPAPNVAQVKPGEAYPDMPPPIVLGLGLAEGDMNAGTQAVLIRYALRELAGLPVKHFAVADHLFTDRWEE